MMRLRELCAAVDIAKADVAKPADKMYLLSEVRLNACGGGRVEPVLVISTVTALLGSEPLPSDAS